MTGAAPRLRVLLAGAWAGLLAAAALIAAPAAFAVLPAADAGRVAARVFTLEAYASLALGVVLLLFERQAARAVGDGPIVSAGVLLALGAIFCTVAGHFGVQPMIAEARAGRGALSFGALHAASVALFGIKFALVSALAWRATAPARLLPAAALKPPRAS